MRITDNEIRELMRAWQETSAEEIAARVELSERDIHGFIEAWKKDFNEVLAPETAESEARRLLDFFGRMERALEEQEAGSEDVGEGTAL